MKLGDALDELHDAEAELIRRLRLLAERHAAESDLYHLGHDRTRLAVDHVVALHPFAERYGATALEPPSPESAGVVETVRERIAEAIGRTELSGSMLLRDLRETYLVAQAAEIAWTIVIQAAKAVRDRDLLDVATRCHAETESTGLWLRTRIKVGAPQVLAIR